MFAEAGLAAAAGVAHWVTLRPPNPRPSDEAAIRAKRDRVLRSKHTSCIHQTFRVLGIGSALAQSLLLAKSSKSLLPSWMLYIRIGYLLAVAGAGVRVWCYKTLARYFTFEIAVQDDQKIIENGPCRFLAHPSYLGTSLGSIGAAMSFFGPYNVLITLIPKQRIAVWDKVSIPQQDVARAGATLCAMAMCAATVSFLTRRIADEEEVICDNFGEAYNGFLASRWRLFPLLY